MNQKNFINILLIVIVFVVFIVGIYFVTNRKPAVPIPAPTPKYVDGLIGTFSSCQDLYSEIDNDIKNANYCKTDSDCDVLNLGGSYIAFGCYHFINKGVDKNKIYEKLKIYNEQKCIRSIDDCASAPKPTCVLNKCTDIKK